LTSAARGAPPALRRLLYLGGLSSALAYGLWNYGLHFLDASEAAPYINLNPIIGPFLSVLILHEPLNLVQVAGGAITLLGVWLSSKGQAAHAISELQQEVAKEEVSE
jgi:drug/metabolite transporter (DMT)-like permease